MIKRLTAIITALLIICVTMCGCGAKQLTAEEYRKEVKDFWTGFSATKSDWAKCPINEFPYGDSDVKNMKDVISRRKDALDNFKKLSPPAEYDEIHKKLVESFDYEYKWIDAASKLANAKTEEEAYNGKVELVNAANSVPDGKSLLEVYTKEVYKKLEQ